MLWGVRQRAACQDRSSSGSSILNSSVSCGQCLLHFEPVSCHLAKKGSRQGSWPHCNIPIAKALFKELHAHLWDMKVQKGLGCVLTQHFHQILPDCKHQKPWWKINTAGNVLAHANEESRNFRHAAPRCLIDTTKTSLSVFQLGLPFFFFFSFFFWADFLYLTSCPPAVSISSLQLRILAYERVSRHL